MQEWPPTTSPGAVHILHIKWVNFQEFVAPLNLIVSRSETLALRFDIGFHVRVSGKGQVLLNLAPSVIPYLNDFSLLFISIEYEESQHESMRFDELKPISQIKIGFIG